MKTQLLSMLTLITLTACCNNKTNDDEGFAIQETYQNENTYSQNDEGLFSKVFKRHSTTIHELKDARTGLVVNTTEYPSDWTVISKPSYTTDQKLPTFLIQITGPDNMKSFNTPIKYHVDYQDPQMAQAMYDTPYRKLMRPLSNTQQIFDEEIKMRMENSGFEFIGIREQPEIEQYLRNKIAQKTTMNTALSILHTEWKNNQNQKALASITLMSMKQPTVSGSMMVWFYNINYTFVDKDAYESTLENLKKATFSYQENPQWQQYVAQLRQQRDLESQRQLQIAANQHQSRMQARWAAFNAHQDKMKGIWAAQDANHASFMNRTFGAGSDVGQKQFINMINEEETVYNPLTGNNYQVNAGSTEYWMDSDGNYIQNDDLFYTPNNDINLNNREWAKVNKAF